MSLHKLLSEVDSGNWHPPCTVELWAPVQPHTVYLQTSTANTTAQRNRTHIGTGLGVFVKSLRGSL